MVHREVVHGESSQLKAQIDGLERFLKLEPRSRILDLACGTGRQTLELARRGHRVLGIDCLEASLSEAQLSARAEKLNAHFLKGDMRQLGYRGEFDAVVNLDAAFGRFPSERDDLKTLEGVYRGLKVGGKLLMDLLNKEWLMRHFEEVSNRSSFNFEQGRLNSASLASLRVYTLTEIKRLIEAAGLIFRGVWGDFDGRAYGLESRRMIVLADKSKIEARPRRPRGGGLALAIKIKGRKKST